jgi:glycosyltransferase involved in cell wall biosynthesis
VHIGLCSPQWPPAGAANGIVSYVSVVRDYLLSQGHGVSIIAGGRLFDQDGGDRPLTPEEADRRSGTAWLNRVMRRLVNRNGALPAVGWHVAQQIRAARKLVPLDLVEMEESFGWCEVVRRQSGVPVVVRLHGPSVLSPPRQRTRNEQAQHRQRIAAEARAMRSAPSLTSPSRAVLGAIAERYAIPATGLRSVIPNPVTLASPAARWRMDGCDRNHVLMVGRFDRWKGADTMLEAFERLLEWRPQARLTMVGPDSGIDIAPGQTLDFEAYAATRLSPQARAGVTFTGKLPPERIAALRRSAYVSVVASRRENFPYALAEGLAAGCPTVSTAWDGSDDIVIDGVSGNLVPVADAEALARRIDWLMANPEQTCRIAENGYLRCHGMFSAHAVGPRLVRHYEATLEAARQS